MLIYVNIGEKTFFFIYINYVLIYVNITDGRTERQTDKHIKSILI
jgi:hypothetical protein